MEYYWKKKTLTSFLLALMVVLIHDNGIQQYLFYNEVGDALWLRIAEFADTLIGQTLTSVAVPLFFLLSGATLCRNAGSDSKGRAVLVYEGKLSNYLQKLKSRFTSLFVPYVLWNTVGMLFMIVCSYTFISRYFVGREIFTFSLKNVLSAVFLYDCNGVFWFVYELIVLTILSPLWDLLTCRKAMAWLWLALTLVLLRCFDLSFLFRFSCGSSLFFYSAGLLIGKYYFPFFARKNERKSLRIVALIYCLLFIVKELLREYSLIHLHTFLHYPILLLACLAFWVSLDGITDKIRIRPFMKDSFFIYALHYDICAVFAKLLYLLFRNSHWMPIPNYFLTFAAAISLIFLISTITRKYFPRLHRLLSGAR